MSEISALLNVFIGALGGAGVALTGAWFLGGRLIEHRFAKEIERYKAGLSQKADVLKTELAIYAHERNIALSRVDAQRAKAIQEVYAALRAWVIPAARIVVGSPYQVEEEQEEADIRFYEQNAEEAHEAGKVLSNALADNAIYFDLETYTTVASLSAECAESIAKFLRPIRELQAEGCPPQQLWSYVEEDRKLIATVYSQRIMPAFQELTDRFRKALGVIRDKAI